MICRDEHGYRILGALDGGEKWEMIYHDRRPALRCGGENVFYSGTFGLDDFMAEAGLAEGWHVRRKQGYAEALRRFDMPFARKMAYTVRHRLGNQHLLVRHDFYPGQGMTVKDGLRVTPVEFVEAIESYRIFSQKLSWGVWSELRSESFEGEEVPLMMEFRRNDGLIIAVGLGHDLWRWRGGLADEKAGVLRCELDNDHGTWKLTWHWQLRSEEELLPELRDFRFTYFIHWYGTTSGDTDGSEDGRVEELRVDE
ncbi:MAG: hypothetical protein D6820_14315, partial [Lentisphaerae bacterium]